MEHTKLTRKEILQELRCMGFKVRLRHLCREYENYWRQKEKEKHEQCTDEKGTVSDRTPGHS